MPIIRFETDYQEGCHPRILQCLALTNYEQTSGYGVDSHTKHAKQLIRDTLGRNEAGVFFLIGGTQTNAAVIKFILKPYEGVISVNSGHINVHESGAIESTGHKIIALPGHNGLLEPQVLRNYLKEFYDDPTHEHMVQPGLVYVSYSSELGTLYTKSELQEIKAICKKYSLKLFIDGARLGAGLTSDKSDMDIKDIADLCDVFYIGGTKNGALFGEAVIFPVPERFDLRNFRTLMKQQGGLLAKGRLLGIQFEALFEEGLYFENARNANIQAMKIRDAFTQKGIPFLIDSWTNQQFPILTQKQHKFLSEKFSYEIWQPMPDGKIAVRLCTSWATTDENINELIEAVKTLGDD